MKYRVKGSITADIEMEIEASSHDEVERMFHDSLAINAVLIDVEAKAWDTIEDSISGIYGTTVEAVEVKAA